MRYVQTSNGSFDRHIRDEFESIRWDETNKTSVRKLPDDKRVEFGISRLQMVTPPAFDSASQTRGEGDAVLVGDVWTQNWVVTDLVGDALAASQADTKQANIDKAVADLMAETAALTADYSQAEIDTFPTQEAEAKAWSVDDTAPTPLLDAILSESGGDKGDLVDSITLKAAALKVAVGKALGRKKASINAASN